MQTLPLEPMDDSLEEMPGVSGGPSPAKVEPEYYPDNQLGMSPSFFVKKAFETEDVIPPTQPSPDKTAVDSAPTTPPLTPTEIEKTPNVVEPKVGESEVTEEITDPALKDLPMVTRESQQAFKDKGQKVSKSDQVRENAHEPPMKRPAGNQSKRAKKTIVAQPVKTDGDASEEEPKKTERVLDEEFKKAADSDCEMVPSDDEEPVKPKRGRKPQPKKPPSPKLRRAAPKGSAKKRAAPKGSAKKRAAAKGSAKKAAAPAKKSKDGEKATFAGRRCPGQGAAMWRYQAMKAIFEEKVAEKMVYQPGTAEDCYKLIGQGWAGVDSRRPGFIFKSFLWLFSPKKRS